MKPLKKLAIDTFYVQNKMDLLLTMQGTSMHPTIPEGWKVKIANTPINQIRTGDIVVFSNNTFNCHRLYGKFTWNDRTYLIHKGDARETGYGCFEAQHLVGKVTAVFDAEDRPILDTHWQKSFFSLIRMRILGILHLYLIPN